MLASASTSQVFVFGDQTSAFESDLRSLLHDKGNESLRSFFEKANYALRVEISCLPISQREIFPRFTCILDLLQHFRESGGNPALGLALLTLNHLARFIKYYGEDSRPYPVAANSYAIGLCTGSFAAAAISTSQTISELIPAALEAVLVSFRTGLVSIEARNDIEQTSQGAPIWSAIVALKEQEAIAAVNEFLTEKTSLPIASRPYLSAVSPGGVTLSGPPSILNELLQRPVFSATKEPLRISVHAPYHASHIHNSSVVNAILAGADAHILTSYASRIPLISCSTGRKIIASNYGGLLKAALHDVLIEQLRWDLVLGGSYAELIQTSPPGAQFAIFPILTNAAPSLAGTLSQSTIDSAIAESSTVASDKPSGKPDQSKIAIVGHSGRFPDAASTEKFWELLHKGLDVHREIPADRFDVKAHYDPTGKKKNTSRIQHGCFIEEPGMFDARFFNMSPRESCNADPGQRLAITTAYEAMEMAGFVPDRTPATQRDRIGIFYGMTSDDWREVNSGQNIDTYFIPGGNRAFTPGRINYHFKFSGPSFSIDTACSSSFAAIHTACNSLWRGDCDTAIAGGTNIMTNPDNFAGLDRGHFLSTTNNCNTFDDNANGYCRADAVGTVILKRLEDAQADKDPIYGVLLGAYTNHSAEADSMTRPHAGAQAFIFNKMLGQANVHPLDVSYIEMHGTGTQTGDAVEMRSVLEVFAKTPRGAKHPLHLGSAKANVGHAESASGVTALIKVLKMMEKNEIPPHVGIKTKINHGFPTDLKARNVNIALDPTPWKRPENGKRTVFLNNFSAAGGNTALLMEDGPVAVPAPASDGRSSHIVAISGKSITSVEKNIQSMIAFIESNPEASLPALSYTTTARRMHHNHRVVVTGNDLASIKSGLQNLGPCKDIRPIQAAKVPNVAFAFTGQGALYTGVAKTFFETHSQFRADVSRFNHMAQTQGFPSFMPLIDGTGASVDALGPVVAQIGAASVQMALTRLWASWGVFPSAAIGHSLGEYAALNAAGVLSASDTIYLVGARAQLLEELCTVGTHSMLAVNASPAALQKYLALTICEIACINGPEATVLSGKVAEIASLSDSLISAGMKCVTLDVPYAFHSAQVETILERFEALAQNIVFHKPAVPFISPLLGEVVTDDGILGAGYLSRACRETVNYLAGLKAAVDANTVSEKTFWVEIGAHPVCSGMVKSVIGSTVTTLPTLRKNTDTWKVVTSSLASLHNAGLEIRWNEYHRDFKACQHVLSLPAYNWDLKNYWIQYSNNFCLTKGDEVIKVESKAESVGWNYGTTSVQKLVEEAHGAQKSSMTIESDLSDPVLARTVQGHKVNGVELCPSSLYADMALTIGDYLLKKTAVYDEATGMDVSDTKVGNPLVAHGNGPQLFRATASADWAKQAIEIEFYSVNPLGKKTTHHAKCTVRLGSTAEWAKEWKRNAYLINSRIEALNRGVNEGLSDKIKRGMAYKLFGAVVEYGKSYQGMEEVILDSAAHEATARVKFQTTDKDGDFHFSPFWVDSFGHIAGFIMNANENNDPSLQVFINHGWDRMRCTTSFSPDKTYQTYNKMQNVGGTLFSGDTYILESGNVVAVFEGVKFQGVPRSVLDGLKSLAGGPKTFKKAPASKAVEAPTKSKALAPAPAQKQLLPSPESFVSAKPSIANKVLAIVAEEVGLSVSDLVPTANFGDFGVDSLLSLNIAGRFREELGLDVESSLFSDCPTVKELVAFLCPEKETRASSITPTSTAPTTPGLESLSAATSTTDETDYSIIDANEVSNDNANLLDTIRLTIAEEIGIPVEELTGSLSFSDVGMDSLLSLTVLGKLREVVDIELSGSLFSNNNTLDEVSAALGLTPSKPAPASAPQIQTTSPIKSVSHPPSSSILLQGNPKTASKILFLFPDGSGSATSYAPLPRLSQDLAVYGLNCPYMKTPESFTCPLSDLTPVYLSEIRRRQPHGPYNFGGWSAGGICAFDAAQQLDREGEKVERLILIDSPFPVGLEKLPPRLYGFFDSIGLFGSGKQSPPPWLIKHFLAFVDALDKYSVKPFSNPANAPKTHIIWARDGVLNGLSESQKRGLVLRSDDPREMKWLLNDRSDFSGNGWEGLVGRGKVVVETMAGANHFTMMAGRKVHELADFMVRAMN